MLIKNNYDCHGSTGALVGRDSVCTVFVLERLHSQWCNHHAFCDVVVSLRQSVAFTGGTEAHGRVLCRQSNEVRFLVWIWDRTTQRTLEQRSDTYLFLTACGTFAPEDTDGTIFVDRDPVQFGAVLLYVREGGSVVEDALLDAEGSGLCRELNFYGLRTMQPRTRITCVDFEVENAVQIGSQILQAVVRYLVCWLWLNAPKHHPFECFSDAKMSVQFYILPVFLAMNGSAINRIVRHGELFGSGVTTNSWDSGVVSICIEYQDPFPKQPIMLNQSSMVFIIQTCFLFCVVMFSLCKKNIQCWNLRRLVVLG